MTPSQFLAANGHALTTVRTGDGVSTIVIPPDPDRYLLVFWHCSSACAIRPAGDFAIATAGFNMDATSRPYRLTHALDGTLVNSGWNVFNVQVGSHFIFIEAFQRTAALTLGPITPPVTMPVNGPFPLPVPIVSPQLPLPVPTVPPIFLPPPPMPLWNPDEDVPRGTRRLIEKWRLPGYHRLPTPAEILTADMYGWRIEGIHGDGLYAIKL